MTIQSGNTFCIPTVYKGSTYNSFQPMIVTKGTEVLFPSTKSYYEKSMTLLSQFAFKRKHSSISSYYDGYFKTNSSYTTDENRTRFGVKGLQSTTSTTNALLGPYIQATNYTAYSRNVSSSYPITFKGFFTNRTSSTNPWMDPEGSTTNYNYVPYFVFMRPSKTYASAVFRYNIAVSMYLTDTVLKKLSGTTTTTDNFPYFYIQRKSISAVPSSTALNNFCGATLSSSSSCRIKKVKTNGNHYIFYASIYVGPAWSTTDTTNQYIAITLPMVRASFKYGMGSTSEYFNYYASGINFDAVTVGIDWMS